VTDPVDVFRRIYATDHWKGGSGEGSVVGATVVYRRVVETLLASGSIRSVVDVGCGDWQMSRVLDWTGVRYTGVDIVPDLIDGLRREFGSSAVRFVAADARTARLPRADLLICKDVLQHWPNPSVSAFLVRSLRRYRFALITNDIASVHPHPGVNADIPLGHWRPLDLEAAPFSLQAEWHVDFSIRDEWTKRTLLVRR
jgi:SAM-dependent methyltransferase